MKVDQFAVEKNVSDTLRQIAGFLKNKKLLAIAYNEMVDTFSIIHTERQ